MKIKTTMYQILWFLPKAVFRGNFMALTTYNTKREMTPNQ
jgi:hypothetical protein